MTRMVGGERDEDISIKSVTLADLQFGVPSRYDWLKRLGQTALVISGALSFGAGIGTAGYFLLGLGGEPVRFDTVTEDAPLATKLPPAALATSSLSDYVGPAHTAPVEIPPPVVASRLPRPRPDAADPIHTGSIARPLHVAVRRSDPCAAFDNFVPGFPFRFRCGDGGRLYPAPQRADRGPEYDEPIVIR